MPRQKRVATLGRSLQLLGLLLVSLYPLLISACAAQQPHGRAAVNDRAVRPKLHPAATGLPDLASLPAAAHEASEAGCALPDNFEFLVPDEPLLNSSGISPGAAQNWV